MKRVIFLDLGNTLVAYYSRNQFPAILKQAIDLVRNYLSSQGLPLPLDRRIWINVQQEDYESRNHRVRPLAQRLTNIFEVGDTVIGSEQVNQMCRHFLSPIFASAICYRDTLPTLAELKQRGFSLGIISNTPWGSPAELWREELLRHGIDQYVDVATFCTDVGWRKPARPIFDHAMTLFAAVPDECIFIGDDPRWDGVGPRALGMSYAIVDRDTTGGPTPILSLIDGLLE